MGMQQPQVVYASPPGGGNTEAMLSQQRLAAQRLAGIQKSFNKRVPPMDRLFKKMGLDVSLKGMLKQSQIFTGTLGAIFQLIGAGIDMFLAPMLPMVIPFIRKMVKALPVFKKLGEQMRDLILGFSRVMDHLIPNFIKKMGGGWWVKAIIAILGVIAFKAALGMGTRFLGRQAGRAARAGGTRVAQRFGRTAAASSSSSSISKVGSSATDALTGRKFTEAMVQSANNTGKISRFSFWKKVFGMTGLLAAGGSTMAFGGNGGGGKVKPPPPPPDGSKWKWPDIKMPEKFTKFMGMEWFKRPEWLKSFMSMDWFKPGKWFDDLLALFGKTPTPPTTKVVPPPEPPTKAPKFFPGDTPLYEGSAGSKSKVLEIVKAQEITKVANIVTEIIDNYSSSRYVGGDNLNVDQYVADKGKYNIPRGDNLNVDQYVAKKGQYNIPRGDTPLYEGSAGSKGKYNIPTPPTSRGVVSISDAAMKFLEGEGRLTTVQTDAQKAQVKLNLSQASTNPLNAKGKPFGGGSPLNLQDVYSKSTYVPVVDNGKIITYVDVPPSDADLGKNVNYNTIQAKNLAAERVGTSIAEELRVFSNVDVVSSGSKITKALSSTGNLTKAVVRWLPFVDAIMDTNDTFNLATNTRRQVEEASGQNVPVINQLAVEGVMAVNALKDAGLGILETVLPVANLVGAGVATATLIKYDDMGQRWANDRIQDLTTVTVGTTKYSGGGDTAGQIATFNEAIQTVQKYGGSTLGAVPGMGSAGENLRTSADTWLAENATLGPVKTEQVVDANTQALLNLSIVINSQTVAQNNREFSMQMQRETESMGGSYQTTTAMTGFDNSDTGG